LKSFGTNQSAGHAGFLDLKANFTATCFDTRDLHAYLYLFVSATLGGRYGCTAASMLTSSVHTSVAAICVQIMPADLHACLYQLERNIAWAANLTCNMSCMQNMIACLHQLEHSCQRKTWLHSS
jgi:hypothetical protein